MALKVEGGFWDNARMISDLVEAGELNRSDFITNYDLLNPDSLKYRGKVVVANYKHENSFYLGVEWPEGEESNLLKNAFTGVFAQAQMFYQTNHEPFCKYREEPPESLSGSKLFVYEWNVDPSRRYDELSRQVDSGKSTNNPGIYLLERLQTQKASA